MNRTALTVIGIATICGIGFVALKIQASANLAREEGERQDRETARVLDNAARAIATHDARQEAQRQRLAAATFRPTRFPGLDGQCLGQGKPAHGYTIEGSTYADNVVVGEAAGCVAFGPDDNNITNFFCCGSDKLPAVLQLNVTITPPASPPPP
jgi:hypothetical protein